MVAQMNEKLEELARFIRETLPQPKAILNLQLKDPPGVVTFRWHQREFLVKPSLEVFEIKGKNIFITGASMLIQTAFLKKKKLETVIGAATETLHQVEEFFKGSQFEKGATLLVSVKKALVGLGGRPSTALAHGAPAR